MIIVRRHCLDGGKRAFLVEKDVNLSPSLVSFLITCCLMVLGCQVIFGLRAESSLYLGIPRLDHQVNHCLVFLETILELRSTTNLCIHQGFFRVEVVNGSVTKDLMFNHFRISFITPGTPRPTSPNSSVHFS